MSSSDWPCAGFFGYLTVRVYDQMICGYLTIQCWKNNTWIKLLCCKKHSKEKFMLLLFECCQVLVLNKKNPRELKMCFFKMERIHEETKLSKTVYIEPVIQPDCPAGAHFYQTAWCNVQFETRANFHLCCWWHDSLIKLNVTLETNTWAFEGPAGLHIDLQLVTNGRHLWSARR